MPAKRTRRNSLCGNVSNDNPSNIEEGAQINPTQPRIDDQLQQDNGDRQHRMTNIFKGVTISMLFTSIMLSMLVETINVESNETNGNITTIIDSMEGDKSFAVYVAGHTYTKQSKIQGMLQGDEWLVDGSIKDHTCLLSKMIRMVRQWMERDCNVISSNEVYVLLHLKDAIAAAEEFVYCKLLDDFYSFFYNEFTDIHPRPKTCSLCGKVYVSKKHLCPCGMKRYCSSVCQHSDWREHKYICTNRNRNCGLHSIPEEQQEDHTSMDIFEEGSIEQADDGNGGINHMSHEIRTLAESELLNGTCEFGTGVFPVNFLNPLRIASRLTATQPALDNIGINFTCPGHRLNKNKTSVDSELWNGTFEFGDGGFPINTLVPVRAAGRLTATQPIVNDTVINFTRPGAAPLDNRVPIDNIREDVDGEPQDHHIEEGLFANSSDSEEDVENEEDITIKLVFKTRTAFAGEICGASDYYSTPELDEGANTVVYNLDRNIYEQIPQSFGDSLRCIMASLLTLVSRMRLESLNTEGMSEIFSTVCLFKNYRADWNEKTKKPIGEVNTILNKLLNGVDKDMHIMNRVYDYEYSAEYIDHWIKEKVRIIRQRKEGLKRSVKITYTLINSRGPPDISYIHDDAEQGVLAYSVNYQIDEMLIRGIHRDLPGDLVNMIAAFATLVVRTPSRNANLDFVYTAMEIYSNFIERLYRHFEGNNEMIQLAHMQMRNIITQHGNRNDVIAIIQGHVIQQDFDLIGWIRPRIIVRGSRNTRNTASTPRAKKNSDGSCRNNKRR